MKRHPTRVTVTTASFRNLRTAFVWLTPRLSRAATGVEINRRRQPRRLQALVKRGDAHLFDVAAGCAFVIGMVVEKLEMLLTVWMR
jgi:hypothetical protein